MKKKFLGFLVSFLALAILATPVMAPPATKVPASTEIISSVIMGPPDEVNITPSGVQHIRGLNYTNTRTLTIDDDTYDVYVEGSFDLDWNPTTGIAIVHFTAVWYVVNLTEPTADGFSGNQITKVLNYDPTTRTGEYTITHLVFQGFGSFAQYTLKLDYEGPYSGVLNPTGYCIIPH